MFVRVKSTPNSPRKSVQIVHSERVNGKVKQKIIKHIGIAYDDEELEELKLYANSLKAKLEAKGQLPLYNAKEIEDLAKKAYESKKEKEDKKGNGYEILENRKEYEVNLLDLIEEDRIIKGVHDIYGKVYDEMGFGKLLANSTANKTSIKVLKEIVLARIANPDSKKGSVEMLEEKFGVNLNLKQVYKMMDKLDDRHIKKLNKLVLNKTKNLLNDKIDVIYFDATTLYFESFKEDDNSNDKTEDTTNNAIKKNGYSKDGKFNQPQVVLALLVTKQGLPIGYKAFSGDTFDGHTIIPSLQEIEEEFKVDNIVYVADSGMFNKTNLEEFDKNPNMTYIVGARVKNMKKSIKEQILDMSDYTEMNDDTKVKTIEYDGKKLLVSYSIKRAKKDKFEREKAIEKLKAKLEKSSSVKSQLSNNGYKKYLQLEQNSQEGDKNNKKIKKKNSCDISIILNEKKIKEDEVWDGIKGIITNNTILTNEELIHQYSNLWQVEESFRITKHDLKIRPIYHWKPSRVKAHLAISFMAYSIVRHLEYKVKLLYKKLSPQKIRTALLGVQASILYDTKTDKKFAFPSKLSDNAKKIYKLMEVTPKTKPYILGDIKLCSA
ncbi:MAG: IS1634 family transposase [Sulfurovaceae bacterium]|nr:IS1634 family transposase [Sulfurovaceae bacterium]